MNQHLILLALSLSAFTGACHALDPPTKLEQLCSRSCESRAGANCSNDECARGCLFILDRLIERETDTVIACVAKANGACGDPTWAECAAKVGVHLDGGPPGPLPPTQE